ncbi:amino acid ABC transporter substrate-binding protein [Aquipseudomonas alcaligenes]|uniref:amino acid ABC transporter substrate-binding protein n=1 Tax=Aquipseudomonas alcaligenes TaxID=43263 RepID=UPI000970DFA7|nr:amino acid ABC transporter substrate-binding protein [Pseudomonas alcaligenes]
MPKVQAEQRVRVGAYHFPPYVVKPESTEPSGLLPELLAALNQSQQVYRFDLVPTSVTRRYRDLLQARYDMILFESPDWGWQGIPLQKLDLQITDAEVYVARAEEGRDQHYFDHVGDKRMALYSGYHYGFAGFNSDQEFLGRQFNAVLTYSHDSNLRMLLHGRADISVVTRSYLRLYQLEHPQESARLLVSERTDQVYHHHALLRPQGPLDASQLAGLLQGLQESGKLGDLVSRYHLRTAKDAVAETANPMPR